MVRGPTTCLNCVFPVSAGIDGEHNSCFAVLLHLPAKNEISSSIYGCLHLGDMLEQAKSCHGAEGSSLQAAESLWYERLF